MTIGELRQSYVVRDNKTTNVGVRLVPRVDGAEIDIFYGDKLVLQVNLASARELALGLNMLCEEMGTS